LINDNDIRWRGCQGNQRGRIWYGRRCRGNTGGRKSTGCNGVRILWCYGCETINTICPNEGTGIRNIGSVCHLLHPWDNSHDCNINGCSVIDRDYPEDYSSNILRRLPRRLSQRLSQRLPPRLPQRLSRRLTRRLLRRLPQKWSPRLSRRLSERVPARLFT